jgi:hypothetical protein
VTAAAYRDGDVAATGPAHRGEHIRGAGAPRDQPRMAVDGTVPHPPGGVVPLLAGRDEPPAKPVPQSLDIPRLHRLTPFVVVPTLRYGDRLGKVAFLDCRVAGCRAMLTA